VSCNILLEIKEDNTMSYAPSGARRVRAAIAGLYARWTLDSVIEAAAAIANDYPKRYRQYRAVAADMADILANIRSRTGFDPEWPNTAQRALIMTPLLGQSDASSAGAMSSFRAGAAALRSAAIAYSERVYDTGEPMLRQAFVNTARHFQAYLTTLSGSVVDRARQDTEPLFAQSSVVLRDASVTQAFGLPPGPEGWPLPDRFEEPGAYLSGDGACLIEEVFRLLQSGAGSVTQQQFLALQRAAVAGGRTIQLILEGQHEAAEDRLREVIGDAYTWATALRDLGTDANRGK
jgi:hypothetical protein